jgi:protein-S-isoprenylcysteine O-methyltransferase Ste14
MIVAILLSAGTFLLTLYLSSLLKMSECDDMNGKRLRLILSTLLASVFTLAITYTIIVVPWLIDRRLKIFFPDLFYSNEPELMAEFVDHVRPIGYASFLLVVALIILGFVTNRKGMTSVGTMAFFLPTFASFAYSMFFMAGLGILRAVWLPLIDIYPEILRLGDIVYVPVLPILIPMAFFGPDPFILWLSVTLAGLVIFLLGIVTWFYAKFEGRGVIDFWAYRYSRHPQYLGFFIWSYGALLRALTHGIHIGEFNVLPSFPWVVSSLLVVCVALTEEIEMLRRHDERYKEYRAKTPFMLPLPVFISRAMTAPARRFLGVDFPTNKREIAYTFVIYCVTFVLLSIPFILIFP